MTRYVAPALSAETVLTNGNIDDARAQRLAELWTAAYPAMCAIMDTVITAQRRADCPTVDIAQLERVRGDLDDVDRGAYRVCEYSPPAFSPTAAGWLVRDVIAITHVGHPQAGSIYRLAAELADLAVSAGPHPQPAEPAES
ncbi:hypothetical protein [Streptomyces sp. NPDC053560]|uniref:hypothetical protein n=1 Tax=Streptomyces sp. NPDC053560 TaxID=3365711 RepID=UPI0037D930D6